MTGRGDMTRNRNRLVVKKTVVLHQVMDEYLRRTWAMLIDLGYGANYSTALNLMLLAAIMEGAKESGFSEQTKETLKSFLANPEALERLSTHESVTNLRKFWGLSQ